jgi:hypothetical protein
MSRGQRLREDDGRVRHGEAWSPLWRIWVAFRFRVSKQRPRPTYQGLDFDPRWSRYEPFREWALANGYQPGLTLDRLDNARGYWPDNCRWATYREQNRNRRDNRAVLRSDGQTFKTLAEAAESVGRKHSGNISACCRGRLNSAYGFHWSYLPQGASDAPIPRR